jgi:hypothetical protein
MLFVESGICFVPDAAPWFTENIMFSGSKFTINNLLSGYVGYPNIGSGLLV